MTYEFKKLSEVETIEEVTETANVLIEEDGVIKKTPKSNVGGAGGVGFDFIIITDNNRNSRLEVGSYQNLYNKIINRELIFGLASKYSEYSDFSETCYFTDFRISITSSDEIQIECVNYYYMWLISENNQVRFVEID